MKKNLWVIGLVLLVSFSVGFSTAHAAGKRISIASAGTGGAWYWVAAGWASVLNKYVKTVEVTNEQTSGATENIRLLDAGKAEIGMCISDVIYSAYNGNEKLGFKKKYNNMRALMSGHINRTYFVALPRTKIKTLKDLKGSGARVSLGPAGTGAEPHLRVVLKDHGVDPEKDIKLLYLSFNEQVEALKDGSLDVARLGGGIHSAALKNLTTTHDVVFVELDKEIMRKQVADNPYWSFDPLPANIYKGQTKEYWHATEGSMSFVREDFPEDLAYTIVKVLIEHVGEVAKVHADAAEWNLQNYRRMIAIPFHPGAIKYYKEKGVWKEK